jgi:hypothetical protein
MMTQTQNLFDFVPSAETVLAFNDDEDNPKSYDDEGENIAVNLQQHTNNTHNLNTQNRRRYQHSQQRQQQQHQLRVSSKNSAREKHYVAKKSNIGGKKTSLKRCDTITLAEANQTRQIAATVADVNNNAATATATADVIEAATTLVELKDLGVIDMSEPIYEVDVSLEEVKECKSITSDFQHQLPGDKAKKFKLKVNIIEI